MQRPWVAFTMKTQPDKDKCDSRVKHITFTLVAGAALTDTCTKFLCT